MQLVFPQDIILRGAAMRPDRGLRAYLCREFAELAVLVGILAVVSRFVRIPTWVWVGLPAVKLLGSTAMYALFLRKTLRQPATGPEALIGQCAMTITPLNPSGLVKLRSEMWTAVSHTGERIPSQQEVQVRDVRGSTLHVIRYARAKQRQDTAAADLRN